MSRRQVAPGGNVFDRAASTYGTVGPDFFGHFGRRLVDCIGIPQGGRVVDLACGTGAALVPAAEAVGAGGLSVGVDLSEAMLRRVDAATDAWSGPPILLACMDAQQLAVRSESFDAVVCGFALGSFPDPLSALGECWRVAHSGGRLGLVVSDRWWWEGDERWSWHDDLLQSIGVPVPVGRFGSAEAIDSLLKETGWELRDLVMESFPMVFAGPDEWWAWAWSHGYRQILESMGAAEVTLYRAECFRQLQLHGQPVLGRLEVSLVCATRPDAERNPAVGRSGHSSKRAKWKSLCPMRSPFSRRRIRPTQPAMTADPRYVDLHRTPRQNDVGSMRVTAHRTAHLAPVASMCRTYDDGYVANSPALSRQDDAGRCFGNRCRAFDRKIGTSNHATRSLTVRPTTTGTVSGIPAG